MKAVLGLEDGTSMVGEGFGVEGETAGELVFTTQMTGYMEALTDASYAGQILMFTFPQIGNYGVDEKNFQSMEVKALACVAREVAAVPEANEPMGRYFARPRAPRHRRHRHAGAHDQNPAARHTAGCARLRRRRVGRIRGRACPGRPLITDAGPDPGSLDCASPIMSRSREAGGRDRPRGQEEHDRQPLPARGADIGVFPHDTRSDVIEAWNPDALFITQRSGRPRPRDGRDPLHPAT